MEPMHDSDTRHIRGDKSSEFPNETLNQVERHLDSTSSHDQVSLVPHREAPVNSQDKQGVRVLLKMFLGDGDLAQNTDSPCRRGTEITAGSRCFNAPCDHTPPQTHILEASSEETKEGSLGYSSAQLPFDTLQVPTLLTGDELPAVPGGNKLNQDSDDYHLPNYRYERQIPGRRCASLSRLRGLVGFQGDFCAKVHKRFEDIQHGDLSLDLAPWKFPETPGFERIETVIKNVSPSYSLRRLYYIFVVFGYIEALDATMCAETSLKWSVSVVFYSKEAALNCKRLYDGWTGRPAADGQRLTVTVL